jgi:serine/threonine-protein kinase
MKRQVYEAAVPPSRLAPTVPPEVDAFVLRMLAKAAKDRPATAAEARREVLQLVRGLQAAQTAVRVPVPAAAPEPVAGLPMRRAPLPAAGKWPLWATAVACTLLGCAAGALAWWLTRR